MLSRLLGAVVGLALFGATDNASSTTIPPNWYTSGYDYSFSGVLGTTDIDFGVALSGTPRDGYLMVPGLLPGRAWFAWMIADATGVIALTSWTGATPGQQGTQFLGETKLDSDTNSSHLGPYPALVGTVLDDRSVTVVICAIIDPNCAYQNAPGSHPAVNYTFYFKLAPIPLPAALPLFATALGGLGLMGWRRRGSA